MSPCTISFWDFPSSHGWWKVTERQGSPEVLVSPLCPMIGSVGYQLLSTTTGGWPTPLKNMSSSVGMIIPISYIYNIYIYMENIGKLLKKNQTTNQWWLSSHFPLVCNGSFLGFPSWRHIGFTIHWHWGHGGGHLNFASKSTTFMQLKSKFAFYGTRNP